MSAATVYLGEPDPLEAMDKARRIFDMLGREFFRELKTNDPTRIISWIARTLMADDLRVDFNDPQDAMLFKLTFGGR